MIDLKVNNTTTTYNQLLINGSVGVFRLGCACSTVRCRVCVEKLI